MMEVIKVVDELGGRLVSTFAPWAWRKDYEPGVATTPDIGYLFAYPKSHLRQAKEDMGFGLGDTIQYWLAEATVVGRLQHKDIEVLDYYWQDFWSRYLPVTEREYTYLLCSSITLISRIDGKK